MENDDLIRILEREIKTRTLPTTNYPYVPASAVRTRLNEAFGARWNTHVISSEIINNETILLKLELTCFFKDCKIVKEGFGSALIQKYSSGNNKGKPVNLGDAYGNALMDGIKACAKQLGIGNKEMDVRKDRRTGRYVRVDDLTNQNPKENKLAPQEVKVENKQKLNELKKRLKLINKPNKEGESNNLEKNNTLTTSSGNAAKLARLKNKLGSEQSNTVQTAKETKTVEKDSDSSEYGFDYEDIGSTENGESKNTQKMVILNLAKIQKLTVEDYIKKAIGKNKTIDELTVEEAGCVVRSGLSSNKYY